jgi:replicative DNA helicase
VAKQETEAGFIAAWWHDAREGKDTAVKVMGHIGSDMLEYTQIAEAYEYLTQRYAAGDSLDDLEAQADLQKILGAEWFKTVYAESKTGGSIAKHTRSVLFNYRARKQAAFLAEKAEEAAELVGKRDAKAHLLADETITKLATFHTTKGDLSKPVSREEITEAAVQRLRDRDRSAGVAMPYPKLQEQLGNLLPGDVVAVSGYSNSGKSLFAANLWRQFALAGVPTISFPTEMGLAWHARGVAAQAKVPQIIAEREQWDRAEEEMIEAYEFGLRELGACPWEIVDKGSISVKEVIARASVLRRRWIGQPVVVIVDHMHRLNYGRDEADFMVGRATKAIRNWARHDQMGGIIAILLYQPRKPADEIELYKPVDGFRIRGKSEVWNEIDILLSPYRRWVKTQPNFKTPWGTPATKYNDNGFPEYSAPNKDGAKLDDERVYLKIGKRRVGGEGPTVVFNIDSPSGHISDPTVDRKGLVVVGGSA